MCGCVIVGEKCTEGQSVRLFWWLAALPEGPVTPHLSLFTAGSSPHPVDMRAPVCFLELIERGKDDWMPRPLLCYVRLSLPSCWHTVRFAASEGSHWSGRTGRGAPPNSQTGHKTIVQKNHKEPSPANSHVTWKQTLPTPQGRPQPWLIHS